MECHLSNSKFILEVLDLKTNTQFHEFISKFYEYNKVFKIKEKNFTCFVCFRVIKISCCENFCQRKLLQKHNLSSFVFFFFLILPFSFVNIAEYYWIICSTVSCSCLKVFNDLTFMIFVPLRHFIFALALFKFWF